MNYLSAYGEDDILEICETEVETEEILISKLCDVCKSNERIYKCPRCAVFSCSLDCCRKHKAENDCSGIRDRVNFVPIRSFNDSNLRNGERTCS